MLSNDAKPELVKGKATGKDSATKPAKLAESKGRKRGGAAAAPRAKRATPKAQAGSTPEAKPTEAAKAPSEKKATKRASKKATEE
jgi:hypothetical protein